MHPDRGYEALPYRAVLEMTNRARKEMTIRTRQLRFARVLARRDKTRLPEGIMHGRVAVQGRMEADHRPTDTVGKTSGQPTRTKYCYTRRCIG